jgi:RimJ/RimL family protein N-acetyltransferase
LAQRAERHDIQQFETGILGENAASIAVSRTLGFSTSGLLDLLAIDADILSKG